MKKMILVLVLAMFGFGVQAKAQVNEEYKTELQAYILNAGAMGSFDQAVDQMLMMMGGQLSDAQKAEIKTRSMDSFIDLLVPVYEKEISIDDLREMNRFYMTPAGKRIAEAQVNVSMGTMQVAQQWSTQLQQIVQEVMTR